jgi:hypothetical protein
MRIVTAEARLALTKGGKRIVGGNRIFGKTSNGGAATVTTVARGAAICRSEHPYIAAPAITLVTGLANAASFVAGWRKH